MTLPPVTYSADRLQEIRTLYGDSCNVLFVSNAALSAMNQAIKSMLWPTRWHDGKRHQELPEIARELYEELTMNLCTVEALGEAIGSALSMVINVNNAQTMPCCGGDAGTVNDDGTINQPPLFIPPAEWEDDFPAIIDAERCKLAYACYEYQGIILEQLSAMGLILPALSILAAMVLAMFPATWVGALLASSKVGLISVLGQLEAVNTAITGAAGAIDNWEQDRDSIVCEFYNSLGSNAVSVQGSFLTVMTSVYGNLLDVEDVDTLVDIVNASQIGMWVSQHIVGDVDFYPQNMPVDYVCCSAPEGEAFQLVANMDGTYFNVAGSSQSAITNYSGNWELILLPDTATDVTYGALPFNAIPLPLGAVLTISSVVMDVDVKPNFIPNRLKVVIKASNGQYYTHYANLVDGLQTLTVTLATPLVVAESLDMLKIVAINEGGASNADLTDSVMVLRTTVNGSTA